MLFVLLLGLLDLVFAVLLVLTHFDYLNSWRIALMGAAYWMGKGVLYRGSFLSVMDFLAGLYFILAMAGLQTPLVFIFVIIMVYKFLICFVMRG